MKTRTLLLLSVGTALMILLAGGALLFQLAGEDDTTTPIGLGDVAQVGDAEITVFGADDVDGVLQVDVEVSGVDDDDGVESFTLVTGDLSLSAILAPDDGRCTSIQLTPQRCSVDFDVTQSAGSSRVLVVRRGVDQATWRLS